MKITPLIVAGLILIPQSSVLGRTWSKNLDIEKHKERNHMVAGWNPSMERNNSKNEPRPKTKIALKKFQQMPELDAYFKKAEGYAVFPTIGKGGFGIGGARGQGEVFHKGKIIGSTTMTQVSIGFQLGGQAFSQIIFFKGKSDLDRFTDSNFEFGASASAALINAGAAKETSYSNGVAVLTLSKGGLMYEASIGGQKFNYEAYE